MKRLTFSNPISHTYPVVQDVNEILAEQATTGEHAADWVTKSIGS